MKVNYTPYIIFIILGSLALGYAWRMHHEQQVGTTKQFVIPENYQPIDMTMTTNYHKFSMKYATKRN